MFAFCPHLRFGSVLSLFIITQRAVAASFLVGKVPGIRRMFADHLALPGVGRVSPHPGFPAVQQVGKQLRVMHIGRRGGHRVNQLSAAIDAYVGFHAKVPLVGLEHMFMRQQTLADEGFERYRKRTRREQFLDEMDKIVPWKGLCEVIEPFYPKPEGAGRPPIGLQRMLRIHFLQHWFNLSDPAVEEALYDSRAMRRFVGIDLGREPAPDETTVCKFRHLLEAHNLGDQLFALIAEYLEDNGLTVNTGTIVDASIIDAPSSTKNKDRKRDPEMHQVKKGLLESRKRIILNP